MTRAHWLWFIFIQAHRFYAVVAVPKMRPIRLVAGKRFDSGECEEPTVSDMSENSPQKNDRDFFRVLQLATAVGMGSMAAFLFSLKQVHPNIRLEFSTWTVVIFLVAGAFSWIFCGVLARGERAGSATTGSKKFIVRWLIFFLTVSALGTLAAFAYALKDVSSASRREVVEGTLIACVVLAVGGILIWKAMRFFEEQSEAELEKRGEKEEHDK